MQQRGKPKEERPLGNVVCSRRNNFQPSILLHFFSQNCRNNLGSLYFLEDKEDYDAHLFQNRIRSSYALYKQPMAQWMLMNDMMLVVFLRILYSLSVSSSPSFLSNSEPIINSSPCNVLKQDKIDSFFFFIDQKKKDR